ncbi:MAG: hypothetical protein COA47_11425 [Robiginitomaculum sp.]|nr:MAG: hypothetical protein COA47_11425 [Robiginitomaculum sp.]
MKIHNKSKQKKRGLAPRPSLVLLMIGAIGILAGCSSLGVKPWERDLLAKRTMRPVTHRMIASIDIHTNYSKEASTGGQSASGGGCGCN